MQADEKEVDVLVFETENVTSAKAQEGVILKRQAHAQFIQEHSLTPAQKNELQQLARKHGKRFEG